MVRSARYGGSVMLGIDVVVLTMVAIAGSMFIGYLSREEEVQEHKQNARYWQDKYNKLYNELTPPF